MDNNLEDAKNAARKAVYYDGEGQYKKALCWYDITARCLGKLSPNEKFILKANEYKERSDTLQKLIGKNFVISYTILI